MKFGKWIAIGLCIAFVLAAYLVWSHAVAEFNPIPQTSQVGTNSCPVSSCGTFSVVSANVTIINSTDITSQFAGIAILPSGNTSMSKLQVFIDNVSIGTEVGKFPLGRTSSFQLGIPTTFTVNPGQSYVIEVEGIYQNQNGGTLGNVWASVSVVARGR